MKRSEILDCVELLRMERLTWIWCLFRYFNMESKDWDRDLLEKADFPVGLLPQVVSSGQQVGELSESWNGNYVWEIFQLSS